MEYINEEFSLLDQRKEYTNYKFLNEKIDNKIKEGISHLEIHHSYFDNLGFRETKLSNCDFSHNVFVNCYFKKTQLWNVDFTGSKFINCNFDGATVQHCDFIYTTFESCFIPYDNMVNNLPNEYNLRENLCRNLAIESLNAGYDKEYKKYFYAMKEAGEKDDFETFRLNPSPYYQKKTFNQKVMAFWDFILAKTSKYIWGYGENINRLVFVLLVIVFGYASLFYSDVSMLSFNGEVAEVTFLQAVFISIMNLCTTSAGYFAENRITEILFMTENILGIVFLGLFVSVVVKNINRR